MRHRASVRLWELRAELPEEARALADRCFELLKRDPRHPSLHLKKIRDFWSVRVASSVLLSGLFLTAACGSGGAGAPGVPRPRPGEPPPGACESIEETLPEGTELVARFKPFPESPRDGSRRGYACVLATIDVRGEVTDVKLLSHDNIRFGDEFRAVVRRWRFDPVLIDGAATEVRTVFTAHFEMHY